MYKCSECNKTCLKPGSKPIEGTPVPGSKMFYVSDKASYHMCPHCNKVHFYGMEKVKSSG